MKTNKYIIQLTSYKIRTLSAVVAIIGLVLVVSSNYIKVDLLATIMRDLGSMIFIVVSVSFLWEFIGKRVFLNEVLDKVGISANLQSAGLIKWIADFQSINFKELIKDSKSLKIVFAYANTWRNNNYTELAGLASKGTSLQIILPDVNNGKCIAELAARFDMKESQLIDNIEGCQKAFEALAKTGGAEILIYHAPINPVVSYYIFDKLSVFALYKQTKGRLTVPPSFLISKDGLLYEYFLKEFDELAQCSKLVFHNKGA